MHHGVLANMPRPVACRNSVSQRNASEDGGASSEWAGWWEGKRISPMTSGAFSGWFEGAKRSSSSRRKAASERKSTADSAACKAPSVKGQPTALAIQVKEGASLVETTLVCWRQAQVGKLAAPCAEVVAFFRPV